MHVRFGGEFTFSKRRMEVRGKVTDSPQIRALTADYKKVIKKIFVFGFTVFLWPVAYSNSFWRVLTLLSLALKDTPINGGLTYEGPKVAEYPGR